MKKIIFLILIIFTAAIISARDKIVKIGDYNWYTEQNSFNEIIEIAKKINKPILAVYSAVWCAPCKDIKKRVFKSKDFGKIEKQMILLYIEETTKEGKAYNKNHKIAGWPTIKIYSKNGILLDSSLPSRSIDGFLSWIKNVKAGKSFYGLLKKIEKNPKDRKSLINIVDNIGHGSSDEKIKYLKRALKINNDFNDKLSQKAYENYMSIIFSRIPFKDSLERTKYINSNKDLINKILNAYYPDKFSYHISGDFGHSRIIDWFNKSKKYNNGLKAFEDFIKLKKNGINIETDIILIQVAFESMLNSDNIIEAEKWLYKTEQFSNNLKNKKRQIFDYHFLNCYRSFIDYYGKLKDIKKAEKYAEKLFELIKKTGNINYLEFSYNKYAKEYGLFAEKRIEEIKEKNKTLKGEHLAASKITMSELYFKIGKKNISKKIVLDMYNNKKFLESVDTKIRARILNSIAWALFSTENLDKLTLKIADESVKLNPTSYNLDTLANVLAGLKKFKEAIKTETKALELAEKDFLKKGYIKNIKKWEKNLIR